MKSIEELRKEWIAEYKLTACKLREKWRNGNQNRRVFETVNLPINKLTND